MVQHGLVDLRFQRAVKLLLANRFRQAFLRFANICAATRSLADSVKADLALRAANDVRFTMIVSLLSMWIFRIGFSYILAIYFNMGILGTWIAMCIDWFCRGACFVIRFARGKWKNISFIDN